MKILILGSGLLGQEFAQTPISKIRGVLKTPIQRTAWSRADLDITNATRVQNKIARLNPDVIINCAAYTKVDAIEQDKQTAYNINGGAVKNLAQVAQSIDALLVHYSTDYVFDGTQSNGYAENHSPATPPLNEYGVSKLQGEQHILNETNNFYIIRTAWLFGQHGNNFIHTVLRLADSQNPITIVNNEYGRPTYTVDLVQTTLEILATKKPFGVYHATNSGEKVSWYEYAQFILQHTNKNALSRLLPITSQEYNAPAPRPKNSILLNTKLRQLRPWQHAVQEYLTNK